MTCTGLPGGGGDSRERSWRCRRFDAGGAQELAGECTNPSDRLYEQLLGAIQTVEAVGEVADDPVAAKEALETGPV